MAKITVKELESLTPNDAGRIRREDGNLAGRISLSKDGVSVSFFYRYRWGEQNKEYACGSWPRKFLTRKTKRIELSSSAAAMMLSDMLL